MSETLADASSPGPVRIRLGEAERELPAGSSVADVVQLLGHAPEAVSTAVNGEFVARGARERVLVAGDVVLLFQPIVGG